MADELWWDKERKQWYRDVVLPDGTRQRMRFCGNRTESLARYYSMMAEIERGTFLKRDDGSQKHKATGYTVAELATVYLQDVERSRAPQTRRQYNTYLAWLVTEFPHLPAAEVRRRHIEIVKAKRLQDGAAPRSVCHFVTIAKQMFNWAVAEEILPANPIQGVKGVPVAPPSRTDVPEETLTALLVLADKHPPLGDFMRVLVNTGMRTGELEGLPWEAYSAEGSSLTVSKHKTVRRTGQVKTIPLNTAARAVIERQLRTGAAIFSDKAGQPITRCAFYQRLRRIQKDHPEFAGFEFHRLRHTFVSRMINSGTPEWVVQQIVGHSSTIVTRGYHHVPSAVALQAVESIARA